MQEIVLLLSGILGAASAVIYKNLPGKRAVAVSSVHNTGLGGEINALKMEKEILTKAMSRLSQPEMRLSEAQTEALMSRYQRQLAAVLGKIERLEKAGENRHFNALGDGLVTLIDQRFSALDRRLHEISSRIATSNDLTTGVVKAEKAETAAESKSKVVVQASRPNPPKSKPQDPPKPSRTEQTHVTPPTPVRQETPPSRPLSAPATAASTPAVSDAGTGSPIEITTLTSIPGKPNIARKEPEPKSGAPDAKKRTTSVATKGAKPTIDTGTTGSSLLQQTDSKPKHKPVAGLSDVKKSGPELRAIKIIDDDEHGEDDDVDDIDKITKDLTEALSKLRQMEV